MRELRMAFFIRKRHKAVLSLLQVRETALSYHLLKPILIILERSLKEGK
jgi:hypothetical protein